jgi:hypothetical protein
MHLAGTRLGPYEILRPLGAWGLGKISRAHDPKVGPYRFGPVLLALLAVVLLPAVQTRTAHAEQPTPFGDYLWLDVDGQPLPFQDYAAIQDVMLSARVVSQEPIGRGVSGVQELLLENAETRFRAAFRTVDLSVRQPSPGGMKRGTSLRDAAIFECAAYEVSQLLGMSRVPPVVERRIGEHDGTVQIWVEETRTELKLREQKQLRPPDLARWDQQRQIMYAFDALIDNFDRNKGNVLLDRSWNMWFIDHTRAFKRSSALLNRNRVTMCERSLWDALRALDEEALSQRLEPYLERREITSLLKRRPKLIRHFQALIDKHGEDAVIFDLRPPETDKADWN